MLGKTLVQILKESKYTTVLSGVGMLQESEYPAIRDGEESYDIESRYGYSIEEMFSSSFYSTRKEQFYEFYRNELLSTLDSRRGSAFMRWQSWSAEECSNPSSREGSAAFPQEPDARM